MRLEGLDRAERGIFKLIVLLKVRDGFAHVRRGLLSALLGATYDLTDQALRTLAEKGIVNKLFVGKHRRPTYSLTKKGRQLGVPIALSYLTKKNKADIPEYPSKYPGSVHV